ncbi:hypothetical protein N7478_003360 [Penicillium angulare]|uniref:uncharacterized protein n=1 Tax=Penicillium angulare TaxID=116970 RepID=UPI0025420974|nr:uncharacterized protein N7478_003360 [Penicillium angulare]KAJ5287674.1 hypothetical protein N7478_003360 [Penicillium angulare]
MSIPQPQLFKPYYERSVNDLDSCIPRYLYKGCQQFQEICHNEYLRYTELNDALVQRYNGQWHKLKHLDQTSYPRYQKRLEELDQLYGFNMTRDLYCDLNKIHCASGLESQSVMRSTSHSTASSKTFELRSAKSPKRGKSKHPILEGTIASTQRDIPSLQVDEDYFPCDRKPDSGLNPRKLTRFLSNPTPNAIFYIDQDTFQKDFLAEDNRLRFSFFRQNILITMAPLSEHANATTELEKPVWRWLITMNLEDSIRGFGGSGVAAKNDSNEIKVPDASYGPKEAPSQSDPGRPSLILEIGNTQSLPSLEENARWWLDRQKGDAKVCITCKLDRNPRLVLDLWERQTVNSREITSHAQHIIITRSKNGEVNIRGSPLHLKFSLVFQRPCNADSNEHDLTIQSERLIRIAKDIWTFQGLN